MVDVNVELLKDGQSIGPANPLDVTGGLTDDELRASPVDVTDAAANGILAALTAVVETLLTNAQLRAEALAVTGPITDQELRAAPVGVSGPLTDVELRTSPVAVSGPLTNSELRGGRVDVADDMGDVQYTEDQTGAGAVLTFTITLTSPKMIKVDVDPVVVDDFDNYRCRATTDGTEPTNTLGEVCRTGPNFLLTAGAVVKVWAPTGVTVNVTGYGRA